MSDLIQKAGFFSQDHSGIYSTLSLGFLLEEKVKNVICEELNKIGFSQIRLSLLHDRSLWKTTGRDESYGSELLTLKNRKNKEFVLAATAEELVTSVAKKYYGNSLKELKVYQIENKYRDEMRAKGGMIRGKEFLMSDAYCFCSDKSDLERIYQSVRQAYITIFNRLGINFEISSSDVGEMGGSYSEEFRCKSAYGEDKGSDGDNYLEIAHIFNLGDRYTKAFKFQGSNKKDILMGCFGIGVSRLIMALLEQNRDSKGFFGTEKFNTFDYILSVIDHDTDFDIAEKISESLTSKGFSVLIDDRNIKAVKKFFDSELIAIYKRVIINKNTRETGNVEVLNRECGTLETLNFLNL